MSLEAHITAAHGWHRFETKQFRFAVVDEAGEPLTLTGLDLEWRLTREAGSATVFLLKTSAAGISLDDGDATNDVAVVSVDDSEYEGAPDLVAGIYRHELWDRTNDVLLAFGDATLLPGSKEPA